MRFYIGSVLVGSSVAGSLRHADSGIGLTVFGWARSSVMSGTWPRLSSHLPPPLAFFVYLPASSLIWGLLGACFVREW